MSSQDRNRRIRDYSKSICASLISIPWVRENLNAVQIASEAVTQAIALEKILDRGGYNDN